MVQLQTMIPQPCNYDFSYGIKLIITQQNKMKVLF